MRRLCFILATYFLITGLAHAKPSTRMPTGLARMVAMLGKGKDPLFTAKVRTDYHSAVAALKARVRTLQSQGVRYMSEFETSEDSPDDDLDLLSPLREYSEGDENPPWDKSGQGDLASHTGHCMVRDREIQPLTCLFFINSYSEGYLALADRYLAVNEGQFKDQKHYRGILESAISYATSPNGLALLERILAIGEYSGHYDIIKNIGLGITPFPIALSGSSDLLKVLIAAGADVNVSDDNFSPVESMSFLCNNPSVAAAIELLVEHSSRVGFSELRSIFLDAETPVGITVAEQLLRHTEQLTNDEIRRLIELDFAYEPGSSAILEALLAKLPTEDRRHLSTINPAALIAAAESGNAANVAVLIDLGYSVDAPDKNGNTPLHLAARSYQKDGAQRSVETLLERGARVDQRNLLNQTPLMFASYSGSPDVVTALLAKGAYIDAQDNDYRSPLMHAAQRGQVEVVKVLLAHAPSLELLDRDDHNALTLALSLKDDRAAHLLISAGANPEAVDRSGRSIVERVTAAIVGKDSMGGLPLAINLVKDPNQPDAEGNTPLHVLARASVSTRCTYDKATSEAANLLLQRGASVNQLNNKGESPFLLALGYGAPKSHHTNSDLVKLFLENKVDPNQALTEREVPLLALLADSVVFPSISSVSTVIEMKPDYHSEDGQLVKNLIRRMDSSNYDHYADKIIKQLSTRPEHYALDCLSLRGREFRRHWRDISDCILTASELGYISDTILSQMQRDARDDDDIKDLVRQIQTRGTLIQKQAQIMKNLRLELNQRKALHKYTLAEAPQTCSLCSFGPASGSKPCKKCVGEEFVNRGGLSKLGWQLSEEEIQQRGLEIRPNDLAEAGFTTPEIQSLECAQLQQDLATQDDWYPCREKGCFNGYFRDDKDGPYRRCALCELKRDLSPDSPW